MRKTAAFFLSLALLFLCACAGRAQPTVQESAAPQNTVELQSAQNTSKDNLDIFSLYKDIRFYEQREGDRILCRVEYPVITMAKGSAYSDAASALDALNADLASQSKAEYERLFNSVRSDIELKVENAGGYYSSTDAYVLRADSRALSILFRTESSLSGGRTDLSYDCANFDVSGGRELAITNVAADAAALSEAVGAALKEKYPKTEFYDLDTAMAQYSEEPERFVWTLDYQGLSFYFAPYELADGEKGPMSVALRFDDYPSLFSLYYTRQPASYAIPLVEGECLNFDMDGDGRSDEIKLSAGLENGRITKLDIMVNSRNMSVSTVMDAYDAYVIRAGLGRDYLLINAHNSSNYGHISVYRLERGGASLVGMLYDTSLHAAALTAECSGIPLITKPSDILLGTKMELLGTLTGVKTYAIGPGGMPESGDEYYRVYADTTLTARASFATAAIDPATGRGLNKAVQVIPGTQLYYLRSDGKSFVDMMCEHGDCCRMYVSGKGSGQTVNGMAVSDCFDGVIYR